MVAEYAYNQVSAPLPSSPQKEYGYRGGKMLVVWDGTQTGDEALKWLVQDHLGSTRMEADKSGRLNDDAGTSGVLEGIRRHDYLPFGEELVASSGAQRSGVGYEPPASNVKQKFGYERDGETGLDFAQARYYSNIQGRFTGPDAPFADQFESDPQSWNLYAYVRNNPCVNTDPTGRNTCYFRPDGSKIGCEGDTRIKIVTQSGEGQLIFTPKKGEREVIDLNNVTAITYASTAPNPIGDFSFEMGRRAFALRTIATGTGIYAAGVIAAPFIGLGNAAFLTTDLIMKGGEPDLGTLAALVPLRPLKFLHSPSTWVSGTAKNSLEFWKKQPTEKIIESLKPGAREPLIVKPDGTIMQGNTRIKVLTERGVDVNSLPRTPY
jgi:RHS repeat-associated protein